MTSGLAAGAASAEGQAFHEVLESLRRLAAQVSSDCSEAGCACVGLRLAGLPEHAVAERIGATCGREACAKPGSALFMLAKLAPLAATLARAGYYDSALYCAEIARGYEPTYDLDLTRAFLYVILGETDIGARLYLGYLRRHRALPEHALAELTALTATHDEEDIGELCARLRELSQARVPLHARLGAAELGP